jgi:hypothetical protein
LHTSDEYQDEAIRCLRLAQALEFEPSKAVLLDLAQQWADVAKVAQRREATVQGSPRTSPTPQYPELMTANSRLPARLGFA